uniref:Putative secreted protein n=1 Tax=Anopheles darlingi TaxID=43151 RepID=A0A2M4D7E9_ANODA
MPSPWRPRLSLIVCCHPLSLSIISLLSAQLLRPRHEHGQTVRESRRSNGADRSARVALGSIIATCEARWQSPPSLELRSIMCLVELPTQATKMTTTDSRPGLAWSPWRTPKQRIWNVSLASSSSSSSSSSSPSCCMLWNQPARSARNTIRKLVPFFVPSDALAFIKRNVSLCR